MSESKKFCSKCGKETYDTAKFCTNCGQSFIPLDLKFQKNSKKLIVISLFPAIFLVTGVMIFIGVPQQLWIIDYPSAIVFATIELYSALFLGILMIIRIGFNRRSRSNPNIAKTKIRKRTGVQEL